MIPLTHLTVGEASDSCQVGTHLDIGPDIRLRAALADKHRDAETSREAAREHGICRAIPHRSNSQDRPGFIP